MEIQEKIKLENAISAYLKAYIENKHEILYILSEKIKDCILNTKDSKTIIDKYYLYLNHITNDKNYIKSFTKSEFIYNDKIFNIKDKLSIQSIKKLIFLSPEQTILALEQFTISEFCNLNKLPLNLYPVDFIFHIRNKNNSTTNSIYFLYDKNTNKFDYCEYVGKIMPNNNAEFHGLYDYHLPIFKIFEQLTNCNIILTNNYEMIKNHPYIYVHTINHISNFFQEYKENFFESIPKMVLNDVNKGNAYYFLNSSQEGVPVAPYYYLIQKVLNKHINSSFQNNIIILSGNKYEEKTINRFNLRKVIPSANIFMSLRNYISSFFYKNKIRLHALRYFEICIAVQYERHYSNYTYELKLNELKKNTFKTFLCFNGHEKEFRYAICFLIWQNNLFQDGSISLRKINSTKDLRLPKNKKIIKNILTKNKDNWHEFVKQLPLIADKEIIEFNYWYQVELELVNNTFLWLITETTFSDNYFNYSFSFLTEKTYKPIALFMPFIMVGDRYSLKTLQEEGYQTFSQWWNEDYDNIACATKRLKKIVLILKEISLKSTLEKIIMYKEMESTLKHNHQLLLSKSKENSFFNFF